jgi:hypothetical protein
MSTTLPLRFGLAERHEFPLYPHTRKAPPEPVTVPWPLKSMGSADCGAERLPDGRLSFWIRHDVVRGVTPRMLVWWFSNPEGDIEISGQRINRYRAWHPYDHVHASYVRRRPDGSIGPGAQIRLREYLGANPAYGVDTITTIEKLDEEGYIHHPALFGISGLVRMEYTFKRVPEGTLYENRLLVGGVAGWRRVVTPLMQRFGFDLAHGMAWLRHNIEEVGVFEHILPPLYRQETGLSE